MIRFSDMKPGQQVRFVRYTQSSIFEYTPGKVYTVVSQLDGAQTLIAPRDDKQGVPREDWGFVFEQA